MHPQNKAFEAFIDSEKGRDCLRSMNTPAPYNKNILWWAFNDGYESGIEDYKNEKLFKATKNLKTAAEKRKEKLTKKK